MITRGERESRERLAVYLSQRRRIMVWQYIAALVAAICAVAHVVFGYKEIRGWTWEFVKKAAPSWIEGLDNDLAKKHIFWAKRLAFNVGAYNLMLAVGLAWTCASESRRANAAFVGRDQTDLASVGDFVRGSAHDHLPITGLLQ
jgi:hypothetical protein